MLAEVQLLLLVRALAHGCRWRWPLVQRCKYTSSLAAWNKRIVTHDKHANEMLGTGCMFRVQPVVIQQLKQGEQEQPAQLPPSQHSQCRKISTHLVAMMGPSQHARNEWQPREPRNISTEWSYKARCYTTAFSSTGVMLVSNPLQVLGS
jgi:hypothetical protein